MLDTFYESSENEILNAFKNKEYKKVLQITTTKIREFTLVLKTGTNFIKPYEDMINFIFLLKAINIKKMEPQE